jgi:hypothetical protein
LLVAPFGCHHLRLLPSHSLMAFPSVRAAVSHRTCTTVSCAMRHCVPPLRHCTHSLGELSPADAPSPISRCRAYVCACDVIESIGSIARVHSGRPIALSDVTTVRSRGAGHHHAGGSTRLDSTLRRLHACVCAVSRGALACARATVLSSTAAAARTRPYTTALRTKCDNRITQRDRSIRQSMAAGPLKQSLHSCAEVERRGGGP